MIVYKYIRTKSRGEQQRYQGTDREDIIVCESSAQDIDTHGSRSEEVKEEESQRM
jgi:hypothetical protein